MTLLSGLSQWEMRQECDVTVPPKSTVFRMLRVKGLAAWMDML